MISVINSSLHNVINRHPNFLKSTIIKYNLYLLNRRYFDNENDNSAITYFEYLKYRFLLMGDASFVTEDYLLNKYNLHDISFLKVGHHGSSTSTSIDFIDKINPKVSLISVGKNNSYGHPNREVIENLENSKIYRTDIDGTIQIILNRKGCKIRKYMQD